MWKPPEYPGPCFDLHIDRFDGFIFEAEKPFENVCATEASPEAPSRNFCLLFVFQQKRFSCAFLFTFVFLILFLCLKSQKTRPDLFFRKTSDIFFLFLEIGTSLRVRARKLERELLRLNSCFLKD